MLCSPPPPPWVPLGGGGRGRSGNAQWFCNPNIDLYLRPGVPSQESTQVLLDPPIQDDDNYRSICAFDPAHKSVVFGSARGCSLLHASLCPCVPVLGPPCGVGQCVAAAAAGCLLVRSEPDCFRPFLSCSLTLIA